MNKRTVVKKTVAIVVSACVGNIVKQIIAKNTDEPDNTTDKVMHVAGSFAIGAMVGSAVENYTDNLIDQIADAGKTGKQSIEDQQ